ncbi:Glycine cleavage system P-protein P1 subunit [Carpediemonas membranifera]|uniref:Glycine cleavage system P-protein P1 subunit n=1 Tax=Carpediemonas membranifera TaxID=201153 RepID=A0A8J6APY2_9EUKA|nr:Glycine cleavage system P-protein P1 subunit [Carpediemonas membranifera]|eukprot:KAG9390691.1 Glycine cleavage system P-protein P1 subunit [Carpediemonas membranifera]
MLSSLKPLAVSFGRLMNHSYDALPYLSHSEATRQQALSTIEKDSIETLLSVIPDELRLKEKLELPESMSELDVTRWFTDMSNKNISAEQASFFLGNGIYHHFIPSVVDHLIQRSEFLTAYTPYQPEVSQGTLQSIFEFQTMVAMITGMDTANASMYDVHTALAEAALMARRITRKQKVVVAPTVHANSISVLETYANNDGRMAVDVVPAVGPEEDWVEAVIAELDGITSSVVVQNPDAWGNVRDLSYLAEKCHENGTLLVVSVPECVSLGVMQPPGAMGADIVIGDGQSLAGPMAYGGPTVGFMACRDKFIRQMPGRFIGETVDADGNRTYVITLATREQHIRREKATSNICTSAGIMSLGFSIHMALLGETGFKDLAMLNHDKACTLVERIDAECPAVKVLNESFFNEFTVRLPAGKSAKALVEEAVGMGILAGVPGSVVCPRGDFDDLLTIAVTEMNTDADFDKMVALLNM